MLGTVKSKKSKKHFWIESELGCLLTKFLFLPSKQNIQPDEISYDSDFPRQLQLTAPVHFSSWRTFSNNSKYFTDTNLMIPYQMTKANDFTYLSKLPNTTSRAIFSQQYQHSQRWWEAQLLTWNTLQYDQEFQWEGLQSKTLFQFNCLVTWKYY